MSNIPVFDKNGNLPPGVYKVSLKDIEKRFAWNKKRKKLFKGLYEATNNFKKSKVKRIWIDGSFITEKEIPNDIDGCWEPNPDVIADNLDPVFLELDPPRESMKKKYGVDFLIAGLKLPDALDATVEDFFQIDRDGNKKGILLLII